MAIRVDFGGLIREARLWYPLDWAQIIDDEGTMPLFVFLPDERGAERFAADVDIELFMRSADATFNRNQRNIVALFLEPADVEGRPSDEALPGATFHRRPIWSTPLEPAGGALRVYSIDDAAFVIERVDAIVAGFREALRVNPLVSGLTGAIDTTRIFLVGMGSGATLAFGLLATTTRLGSAAGQMPVPVGGPVLPLLVPVPKFAGAAVLGGTLGGKPFADTIGAFPGNLPFDYAVALSAPRWRFLSIQFDTGVATQPQIDMQGHRMDDLTTALVPAVDSTALLVAAGIDPSSLPGSDLVRLERTHGCSVYLLAHASSLPAQPQLYTPGVWVHGAGRPHDAAGAPIPAADLLALQWKRQSSGRWPTVIWRSREGMLPGQWPSIRLTTASWDGLVAVVEYLAFSTG